MNKIEKINSSNWHDYMISKIIVEYDDIVIYLSGEIQEIAFCCKNFIGIKYIGHWDESVVKDINISKDGRLKEESLSIIEKNNNVLLAGGGKKYFNDEWYEIMVELIDGSMIVAVCNDFDISVL